MKTVEKKILPQYLKDIIENGKRFEIRKDDDNIQAGDILRLREWNGMQYTGLELIVLVHYVLRNVPEFGLKDGYCVFCW